MASAVMPVAMLNVNFNVNWNFFFLNFNFNVDSPGMLSDKQLTLIFSVYYDLRLCCCMDIPQQPRERLKWILTYYT